MTPAEFIDEKGGPAALTRAINEVSPPDKHITAGAVALWRHRNKLPRTAWPEIVEAFPRTTLEQLKTIESAGELANAGDAGEPQGAAA